MKDIKDYIKVDPTSPSGLRWIKRPGAVNKVVPGNRAGWRNSKGYWEVKFKNHTYKCHRLVLKLSGKQPPSDKHEPDHINGNPGDNRIENLRWVTPSQNCDNRNKPNKHNLRWVWRKSTNSPKPYSYKMQVNGKQLGGPCFSTPEEAHAAALAKRKELGLPIIERLSTVKL